jgi:hypothetical protein
VTFNGVAVNGSAGFGSSYEEIVMIAPPTKLADPQGSITSATDDGFFVQALT